MVALSSTDIDSKVSGTWKVRARHSRARSSGGRRVTSAALKITVPELSGRSPVRQLKKVDLPAPLGPIRPRMSPSSTVTDASSTALNAPNALVTWRASISMASHLGRFCRLCGPCRTVLQQRQQAARQEAGDDDDDGAVDHEGEARTAAAEIAVRQLRGADQGPRAGPRAGEVARAAQGRHHHHLDRDQDAEARFGIDEAEHAEIERACERGEGGAQHVGLQLVEPGRD